MAMLEFRAGVELRALPGRKLVGYAAVFGSEARITSLGASFRERVAVGAFARSLAAKHSIPALVDHDPSKLLARTPGTLRLAEDTRGLRFEIAVPDTQLGHDMMTMAERQDLAGMSIGFRIAPGGDAWPAADLRELLHVDLIEVSIAQAWPAYADTTISPRTRQTGDTVSPVSAAARRRLLDML